MSQTATEVGMAASSAADDPGSGTTAGTTAGAGTEKLSYDEWARESTPRLLHLARLIGHEQHAAHDAVQDALLAVLVRWRRLHEPGAADAYARRVVVNRRISWWRRVGRREHPVEVPERAAPAGDATDAVLARRLVVSLGGAQRAAVVLRFFDDLSFAEIADALGCAEATARSHVHRALARLRTELQEGR